MIFKTSAVVKVFLWVLTALAMMACSNQPDFKPVWSVELKGLGTSSSPQCADLNRDGILDIVVGASKNEFDKSDSSVVALDGKTGKMLWHVFAKDQVVGSALFLDITRDSIPEIFIGGRSAEFMCIDGSSGKVIWRFTPRDDNVKFACCFKFNFFNPQLIADQDNDGISDLLVSNGGNVKAPPHSESERYPGILAVMSSATGNVLALDTMPDGKETYMTPVIHDFGNPGNEQIVFGTGGETLGGNLFIVPLKSLLESNISKAVKLAAREKQGFIGPPTLADITQDGIHDIIINWFGGEMIAINGKDHSVIWQRTVAKTESYSTPAPGFFNDDAIPDFFSTYNKGAWPDNRGSVQLAVDGKTGNVLFRDSIGCMGYSSGVTIDLNADGLDEVIFSVNDYECNPPAYAVSDFTNDQHSLRQLDMRTKKVSSILAPVHAKNVSSTPWIGDLDGDGKLDIIFIFQQNTFKVDRYNGIYIYRLTGKTTLAKQPTWGAYLNHTGTGVFTP